MGEGLCVLWRRWLPARASDWGKCRPVKRWGLCGQKRQRGAKLALWGFGTATIRHVVNAIVTLPGWTSKKQSTRSRRQCWARPGGYVLTQQKPKEQKSVRLLSVAIKLKSRACSGPPPPSAASWRSTAYTLHPPPQTNSLAVGLVQYKVMLKQKTRGISFPPLGYACAVQSRVCRGVQTARPRGW